MLDMLTARQVCSYYALILDLFAPPEVQFYHLFRADSIGAGPTRGIGIGNSDTGSITEQPAH